MIFVCPDGEPQYREAIEGHAQRLRDAGHEFRYFDGPPRDLERWAERLAGAEGVLLLLDLPTPLLSRQPELAVVSFVGTGVRAFIDVEAAAECGITVCNVPAYGADSVAEHAFALALAAARAVPQGDRMVRAGEWGQQEGVQLRGKTLGVLGAGPIGTRTLEIGRAFGMRCLYWTRRNSRQRERALGAEYAGLEDLFARADVVSVHLAHTAETEGLLDAGLLGSMRSGAILVNTARGAIVDQQALASLLAAGQIRAAGLDVFAAEPPHPDDPLLSSERAVLTPHVGFCTPEANDEMISIAVDNLLAFGGGEVRNVVR